MNSPSLDGVGRGGGGRVLQDKMPPSSLAAASAYRMRSLYAVRTLSQKPKVLYARNTTVRSTLLPFADDKRGSLFFLSLAGLSYIFSRTKPAVPVLSVVNFSSEKKVLVRIDAACGAAIGGGSSRYCHHQPFDIPRPPPLPCRKRVGG